MSLLKLIKQQLGLSVTPSENHHFDGSTANQLKLKKGTPDNPGIDVMTVDSAGKVVFPQMPVHVDYPITNRITLGSNQVTFLADGTFILGTQVVVANPVINTYVSVDFSAGFTMIGAAFVTASINSGNAAPTAGFVYATALNTTTFRITVSANAVSTNTYNVIAIGRWR